MQELLFPELSAGKDDPFDGFKCMMSTPLGEKNYVCLFAKQDNNGKKIYLVGERTYIEMPHGAWLKLHNVREYKHSFDRANHDYKERLDDPR